MAQTGSSIGGGSTSGASELFFDAGAMRKVAANHIPNILPHERVFPVQIGSELFKLSGASISSDGASPLCSHHSSLIAWTECAHHARWTHLEDGAISKRGPS